MKGWKGKMAVVGATGLVGQEFASILAQRGVSPAQVAWLASSRSSGQTIAFGDRTVTVQPLETFDFKNVQVAFLSAGAEVSKVWAEPIERTPCWVIDNTSFFRMNEDIPLVVPEINAETLKKTSRRLISNPNCSTIQMVVALAPLDLISPLKRIVVSTYQAISGAGRGALNEFLAQERGEEATTNLLPRALFRNLIPQIDSFLDDGSTKEERKMVQETCKIFGREIPVSATCVRVPVIRGHSEAVTFQLQDEVPLEALKEALRQAPGIVFEEAPEAFTTPLEVEGRDEVFVSRLRKDPSVHGGYQMWVVADNLRKGAALNSLQIFEKIVEFGLLS